MPVVVVMLPATSLVPSKSRPKIFRVFLSLVELAEFPDMSESVKANSFYSDNQLFRLLLQHN